MHINPVAWKSDESNFPSRMTDLNRGQKKNNKNEKQSKTMKFVLVVELTKPAGRTVSIICYKFVSWDLPPQNSYQSFFVVILKKKTRTMNFIIETPASCWINTDFIKSLSDSIQRSVCAASWKKCPGISSYLIPRLYDTIYESFSTCNLLFFHFVKLNPGFKCKWLASLFVIEWNVI